MIRLNQTDRGYHGRKNHPADVGSPGVSGPPGTATEPEVVIGELDGPVGIVLATLTGIKSKATPACLRC